MRTTFSRLFLTTLSLLLVGLLLVGASFRLLVENYMEESAVEGLRSDAQVISGLASVYISDDSPQSQVRISFSDDMFICNVTIIIQLGVVGLTIGTEVVSFLTDSTVAGSELRTGIVVALILKTSHLLQDSDRSLAGGMGGSGCTHGNQAQQHDQSQ